MNKEKKKFTFENWLNGKFGTDEDPKELSALSLPIDAQKLFLGYSVDKIEFQKITEARKEAYQWATEITVDKHKKSAKKKIKTLTDKGKDPKKWIQLEINRIEKFINDYPELGQKVEFDSVDVKWITGERYQSIKHQYERFKKGIIAICWIEEGVKGNMSVSKLHRKYVYKEYLKHLKSIREKFGTSKKLTEKEQIERVEEIYRDTGNYEKAIKRFNKEMDREVYTDYASFKAVRYRIRNKQ